MSDFRDPNDPNWRESSYEPASGTNVGWGWIAAALFVVIVAAIAFGTGHGPTQTASNDIAPPAINQSAPPMSALRPINPAAPGLTPPAQTVPPAPMQPQ
jgi:hypothetical protein